MLILLASIILNILIIYFFRPYSVLTSLIIISAIFLILYSFIDLINSLKNKNLLDNARIISHLGFGLLVFFIGINHNFSIEKDFNLKQGEKKIFEKYSVNFKMLKLEERENYKAVIGIFDIQNLKNSKIETLEPEIRIYSKPQTLTYEASIKTKLNHDLYLTMSNVNRSDFYNIKFQEKPFMIWIWLSALLITIGGFIRVLKK